MGFHRGCGPQRLLSHLGPTPGPARRSLGETRISGTAGSRARPRPDLLRDDMDCAESRAEGAGAGRARAGYAHDTNARDTKTTRTRSASMRLKARLYLTVAAIGLASLLAAAPAQLSAQT